MRWLLTWACCLLAGAASAADMRWQSVPPIVAVALDALRQTNASLAEAMNENLDGDNLGRRRPDGLGPSNFDAASHLSWVVADVNGDGQMDVFFAVEWSYTQGTGAYSMGALMVQDGRPPSPESAAPWRLACETSVFVPRDGGSVVRLLPGRGWRAFEFRGTGVRPVRYTWRRGADGRMACRMHDEARTARRMFGDGTGPPP